MKKGFLVLLAAGSQAPPAIAQTLTQQEDAVSSCLTRRISIGESDDSAVASCEPHILTTARRTNANPELVRMFARERVVQIRSAGRRYETEGRGSSAAAASEDRFALDAKWLQDAIAGGRLSGDRRARAENSRDRCQWRFTVGPDPISGWTADTVTTPWIVNLRQARDIPVRLSATTVQWRLPGTDETKRFKLEDEAAAQGFLDAVSNIVQTCAPEFAARSAGQEAASPPTRGTSRTPSSGLAALTIGFCAAERTVAADRQNVTAAMREGRAFAPDLAVRIQSHVDRCSPAGEPARSEALLAAVSYIARGEIGRDLSRSGVDPRIVDRWFERQNEAVKVNVNVTETQGGEFVRQLIAAGAPAAAVNANEQAVGSYLATLIFMERLRRGLGPAR